MSTYGSGVGGSQGFAPPGPHPGHGPGSEHVRNIARDIVLTIVTLGFYNFWVQHRQMVAVNAMLRQEKYEFWKWLVLSLITCGIYHIYHEFKKSDDIGRATQRQGSNEGLVNIVLTVIGLGIVADAIQQSRINEFFGSTNL